MWRRCPWTLVTLLFVLAGVSSYARVAPVGLMAFGTANSALVRFALWVAPGVFMGYFLAAPGSRLRVLTVVLLWRTVLMLPLVLLLGLTNCSLPGFQMTYSLTPKMAPSLFLLYLAHGCPVSARIVGSALAFSAAAIPFMAACIMRGAKPTRSIPALVLSVCLLQLAFSLQSLLWCGLFSAAGGQVGWLIGSSMSLRPAIDAPPPEQRPE